MAGSLHRIYQNFMWRIEGITPNETRWAVPRFRRFDPYHQDVPDGSGGLRMFFIQPTRETADVDATSREQRESFHRVVVHVMYPVVLRWEDMLTLRARDRDQIIKELRDPAKMVGYDDDNTSTDIGLMNYREKTGVSYNDDIDARNQVTRMSIEFTIKIREDETS